MSEAATAPDLLESDANKYRPFASIESAITANLRNLLSSTTPPDLSSANNTMLSGALTLALSYISKQTLAAPSSTSTYDPTTAGGPAGSFNATSADGSTSTNTGLTSRILLLSVSGDLAQQYIPIMNSIFACQRLSIPIDILTLSPFSKPEFLQQAADATGGIFMSLGEGNKYAGILQILMMAYLPDQSARRYLVQAGEEEGVDFRAACFCHGRVVDLGWVCSICLSSESLSFFSFGVCCIAVQKLTVESLLRALGRQHVLDVRNLPLTHKLRTKSDRGTAKEEEAEEVAWRR